MKSRKNIKLLHLIIYRILSTVGIRNHIKILLFLSVTDEPAQFPSRYPFFSKNIKNRTNFSEIRYVLSRGSVCISDSPISRFLSGLPIQLPIRQTMTRGDFHHADYRFNTVQSAGSKVSWAWWKSMSIRLLTFYWVYIQDSKMSRLTIRFYHTPFSAPRKSFIWHIKILPP